MARTNANVRVSVRRTSTGTLLSRLVPCFVQVIRKIIRLFFLGIRFRLIEGTNTEKLYVRFD